MASWVTCLLLCAQPVQPPTPPRVPLAADIVIEPQDYLLHLYGAIGSAHLEDLVLDRILEREVAASDLERAAADVKAALADPDATARRLLERRIAEEHGGDRDAYRRSLAVAQVTEAEDLWSMRQRALRQYRIAALVQQHRTDDARALRRLFDDRYGVDGLRVRVRHVFLSFGAERARARAAGQEATEADLEAAVRARAEALWREHVEGAAFADLVAKGHDDPHAREEARDPATREAAGAIAGYNFQEFGPELADLVRAMRPGDVRGPLRSSHGYHIVRLDHAERTQFADVEDELRAAWHAQPPSLAETRLLRERLFEKYRVAAALAR
jgi:hypothetical protein